MVMKNSGKSSLVATLFRLLDIASGRILIGGIDIASIPRESVRAGLIGLPQEPFFTSGSVRANINLTNTSSTDAQIQEVLEKVKLWDKIKELGGLDVELNPEGIFSHGQQQLFCLARTMLQEGSIVVLDEATSA